jgi:hypothetical protein
MSTLDFVRVMSRNSRGNTQFYVPCGGSISFSGNVGIYYAYAIVVGTQTGTITAQFDSFDVPDRFQLYWNGILQADSLYVGDNLYSGNYDISLVNNSPYSLTKYEYGASGFTNTGNTETVTVTSNDLAPSVGTRSNGSNGNQIGVVANYPSSAASAFNGQVQLSFNKNLASPTTITIIATGPISGTGWDLDSFTCPS